MLLSCASVERFSITNSSMSHSVLPFEFLKKTKNVGLGLLRVEEVGNSD